MSNFPQLKFHNDISFILTNNNIRVLFSGIIEDIAWCFLLLLILEMKPACICSSYLGIHLNGIRKIGRRSQTKLSYSTHKQTSNEQKYRDKFNAARSKTQNTTTHTGSYHVMLNLCEVLQDVFMHSNCQDIIYKAWVIYLLFDYRVCSSSQKCKCGEIKYNNHIFGQMIHVTQSMLSSDLCYTLFKLGFHQIIRRP